MAKRRSGQGFTLIELTVVVCVIGLLAFFALDRLGALQEAAEEAAAERNLGALKAALMVRSAAIAGSNRWQELVGLQRSNPFNLLDEVPGNYAGEMELPPEPGFWSYSPKEQAVTYSVRHGVTFRGDGNRRMTFRVIAVDAGGYPSSGGGAAYVKLLAEKEYFWQERLIR